MTITSKVPAWAALLILAAAPAHAHVTLERGEAPRGNFYKAVLKVPHGCDGTATHTVRVDVPEGFVGVKPMPKPGWTLKTTRGAYAQSYGTHHGSVSEGVRQIEWSDGDLPDDYYDEFVANGFIARELTDTALYFKVVQECAKGEERWTEVPTAGQDPHDLKAPAAVLRIADNSAAGTQHDHHGHGDAKAAAAEGGAATIGSLAIEGAWTRATADGAKVGAGYLTIRNTGSAADTLVGIKTSVAGRGEIHDMTMTDGVMRMRHLPDGIEIPAGGNVTLQPGGMHLMFMDLKEPLVQGATVTVTLTFKSGATGDVVLPVRALGAKKGGDHKSGDHNGHSHH
ncbi:DUF1775 domain-containing protein [Hyphomicrobium sp.]|uniref:DUF1775 domain-containing protein n=1 Tax=Hyphomicrobium sp. TaxID=82 RepID=UPI002FDF78D4